MRLLILHADKFATTINEESKWPKGIDPEKRKSDSEEMEKCLVVFFCVEKEDGDKQVDELYQEILKTADEVQTKNIMISPFVHLSNNIATPDVAKKLYEQLMGKFIGSDFVVKSSHFGYHKSLLLDIKGHPGSFRYREFY
ncbi:MAG: threonyl-tRNA synthetase editing domain-containing protein [Patescibacteria group bacterium]